MNDVITKGPYRGLRFAKRQIQCSRGNSRMRCGKCGGMDFEVHVRPVTTIEAKSATGKPVTIIGVQTCLAQVAELICLGCLKVRKLDNKGIIQALGKVEPTRLVDPDYVAPEPTDVRAEQVRKANGS